MKDLYNLALRGHFKVERYDSKDNLIDVPVDDHNMIMTNARLSMAEIFANLESATFAHRFMLGTLGHEEGNVYLPKESTDGFVKERDRMFSQVSGLVYSYGDMIDQLCKNDILQIISDATAAIEYWRYNGETTANYILDKDTVVKTFTKISDLPYTLTVDFTLPRDNNVPDDQTNTPEDSPYIVQVKQHDTSVSFIITIPMDYGNEQYINQPEYGIPTSVYTEASLWVNGRIFSMKTFQGVTKDDSIKLKITWTIIF